MVKSVVLLSCSCKEIKIVNAYQKKVSLWGASWRAVSLWLCEDCPELHSPDSLQQAEEAPCCMNWPMGAEVPSGVWCANGAILSTSMRPWDPLGAAAPRCYNGWPRGKSPQKARQGISGDSSPELIILVVLSVSNKRDTEAESKAYPLPRNTSFLDSGLCAFSALTWLFVSPSCWLKYVMLEDTSCQNAPFCAQVLLVSLLCCDARVLQWDHAAPGA